MSAYQLVSVRDGYTRRGDYGSFPRWALVLSADGVNPIKSRDGRRLAVVARTVSGKAAPLWHARCVGYVRALGGVTGEEAGTIAEWFRTHRVGVPVECARVAA